MQTLVTDAIDYLKRGLSVIPIKGPHYAEGKSDEERSRLSKRPLISWTEFQKRHATENEVMEWFERYPYANLGIITGEISNILVIDFDSADAISYGEEHNLFDTPTVETGRGCHAYYKFRSGVRNFQNRTDLPDIDVRGEGGYIIAPPSLHISKEEYRWRNGKSLGDIELAEVPEEFLIKISKEDKKTPLGELYIGVGEGRRNAALTKLVGSWVSDGLSFSECFEMAEAWNSKNQKPLSKEEIESTIRSILKKENKGSCKKSITQSDILLNLTKDFSLFHDQNKQPYLVHNNEAVSLKSNAAKQILSNLMYRSVGKIPDGKSLIQVIEQLQAKAIFESPQRPLYNRVASTNGTFWYDLGDGRAVKITPEGWNVVPSPILFRRHAHQQVQVTPVHDGNINLINRFFSAPEESILLLQIYIIANFISDFPHPILHPVGSQGSGKSTLCRIIKKLCDPSSVESLIIPKNQAELMQVLNHHHVCFFDNLSDLPNWMSDIFAQVCTGSAFSKRQLYTDDDDVIYQLKKSLVINGIKCLPKKPDLFERTILINLERIDGTKRIDEHSLWTEFEKVRPQILGGIFDAISRAMAMYPNIKPPKLERMADFTIWGYAIAEALGKKGEEFHQAYRRNLKRQNETIIQNSALAQAVLSFMANKPVWKGSVKEAFEELEYTAHSVLPDNSFPRGPRLLRSYLEEIKVDLAERGITFEIMPRTKDGFFIIFKNQRISRHRGMVDSTIR